MNKKRNIPTGVLIFAVFLVLRCLSLPASAQQGETQVQQLVKTGRITPWQAQQAMEVLNRGQISPDAVKRLQERGQLGTLTTAEIESGKKILEQRQETDQPQPPEPPGKEEPSRETKEDYPGETSTEGTSGLTIFGHELFSREPSTFSPISAIPVSNNYIIGPGDEIKVLMWGRLDAEYSLDVDSEGVINFPTIGPLTVAGLTYGELKEQIRVKAEAITGVNVNVSMGKLRTIQVFVLGEVKYPGVYTVSSLATIANALLSSGGPTPLGSLRKVELKRLGKVVTTVDLYDFLLRGDTSKDTRLMPGDVIFIPQVGPMISVSGNVKRPAIYELNAHKTLQAALELAGGLSPRAYNQRIQIERFSKNQIQIVLDITYEQLEKEKPVPVEDGDLVEVFSILPTSVNAVYLYGNVLRPGQYAFKEGTRLLDILPDLDSLDMDTYFDYALIKRYRQADMKAELLPFDLGRLLRLNDKSQNTLLQPLDEIYIFSKWVFEDRPSASVEGEVRHPGDYPIEKMRVKDLIFKAGNLTKDAYLELGHIYRTDSRTKELTIHTFDVGKALAEDPEHNLLLRDQDHVVIHSTWEYVQKYDVSIRGMVNKPGLYPYANNMTVHDLILLGGHVRDSAYMEKAELVRIEIIDGRQVRTSVLNFNVRLALERDPRHDLKLQPLDVVHIKQIPEWGEAKKVTITGEVHFPGTFEFRKDERLSSIIERAGGFTDFAFFRGAVFTRESVREIQQQRLREMIEKLKAAIARVGSEEMQAALSTEDVAAQEQVIAAQEALIKRLENVRASGRIVIELTPTPVFVGSSSDLVLEDGDLLHIPQRPQTVNVLGEVYNPTSLIFEQDNPKAKYYLAKTGGCTDNADKDQMYIIRANGTVDSKKGASGIRATWFSGFENTTLYPGDTILVPQRLVYPNWMRDVKDITQILYQIAVTAGLSYEIIR